MLSCQALHNGYLPVHDIVARTRVHWHLLPTIDPSLRPCVCPHKGGLLTKAPNLYCLRTVLLLGHLYVSKFKMIRSSVDCSSQCTCWMKRKASRFYLQILDPASCRTLACELVMAPHCHIFEPKGIAIFQIHFSYPINFHFKVEISL